jgi:glutaredoxin
MSALRIQSFWRFKKLKALEIEWKATLKGRIKFFASSLNTDRLQSSQRDRTFTLFKLKHIEIEYKDVLDNKEAIDFLTRLNIKQYPAIIINDIYVGDYEDLQTLEDSNILDGVINKGKV